ncbi:hypothetical protein ACFXA3_17975 [Streptomyces sp. NPDC059456]|uniref:hypothetical protein n=1 Tax=Streptomyces sp. NPDC059456 TaxID=3346838 RepID=UPI00367A75DA
MVCGSGGRSERAVTELAVHGIAASGLTGLVLSAVTDTCGLAVLLGRLPFNRRGPATRA